MDIVSKTKRSEMMSNIKGKNTLPELMVRKYLYSKQEEDKGIAELIVSKHRNGPTGTIKLTFFEDFAKFLLVDPESSAKDCA